MNHNNVDNQALELLVSSLVPIFSDNTCAKEACYKDFMCLTISCYWI